MNKFSISLIAAATGMTILLGSVDVKAQNKIDTTAKKVGKKIDTTAKKVGNKAASTAVKGVATVKDKVYKGKEAPDGSPVYIDKNDRKYYVDEKGKKIFLKPSQIRDKKD
ncbi:hypothetical protein ACFOTA_08710 [Chitinophaga sp. GCM10012297]|uniref:PBCV-specific basic adaptor domain-containing protein n=1 Tax=Chitinophaga chungangae TaxID=2821488 RepID=A0ABS3YC90_9BACT|nr:hypothetical protein [Chitinophaga chungangae]MBO9152284.1 hypothetical protein [Chitinophaga chungangae]